MTSTVEPGASLTVTSSRVTRQSARRRAATTTTSSAATPRMSAARQPPRAAVTEPRVHAPRQPLLGAVTGPRVTIDHHDAEMDGVVARLRVVTAQADVSVNTVEIVYNALLQSRRNLAIAQEVAVASSVATVTTPSPASVVQATPAVAATPAQPLLPLPSRSSARKRRAETTSLVDSTGKRRRKAPAALGEASTSTAETPVGPAARPAGPTGRPTDTQLSADTSASDEVLVPPPISAETVLSKRTKRRRRIEWRPRRDRTRVLTSDELEILWFFGTTRVAKGNAVSPQYIVALLSIASWEEQEATVVSSVRGQWIRECYVPLHWNRAEHLLLTFRQDRVAVDQRVILCLDWYLSKGNTAARTRGVSRRHQCRPHLLRYRAP